jgi:hypothetical protein
MQFERVHQVVGGTTIYNPQNDRAAFVNGRREIPENSRIPKKQVVLQKLCNEIGIRTLTKSVDGLVTKEEELWRPKIITAY